MNLHSSLPLMIRQKLFHDLDRLCPLARREGGILLLSFYLLFLHYEGVFVGTWCANVLSGH